jgi:hypothetical protein
LGLTVQHGQGAEAYTDIRGKSMLQDTISIRRL